MENLDEKIKELFHESIPEMASDTFFLQKVEAGMDAIDMVMLNNTRNKQKVLKVGLISGFAGFLCGLVLTMLFPYINSIIQSFLYYFLTISFHMELICNIFTFILIAVVIIIVSLSCYSILNNYYIPIQTSTLLKTGKQA